MSTPIGFVIKAGEAIPEDVTGVDDSTGVAWERIGEWPSWRAGSLHYDGKNLVERRAPLTVTAVRPQPAESVSGLCEVGDDGVTCIVADADHRRIYHGGSTLGDVKATLLAAESESVDVLDLVRKYGDRRAGEVAGRGVVAENLRRDYEALFARIEAEVNRLRESNCRHYDKPIAALGAENITQALAEVEELRAKVERLNAEAERVTDELVIARDERDDYAARLKATDRSWTEVARERDEARTEVDRLRRLLDTQAKNFAEAYNKLAEGASAADPLVLSLPSVPDGAILVGERTKRHWIWSVAFDMWVTDNDRRNLGDLLDLEGSVSVVMREPIVLPLLTPQINLAGRIFEGASGRRYQGFDDNPSMLAPVDEVESGFFARHHVAYFQESDGPLVEVFDEDGTRAGGS